MIENLARHLCRVVRLGVGEAGRFRFHWGIVHGETIPTALYVLNGVS